MRKIEEEEETVLVKKNIKINREENKILENTKKRKLNFKKIFLLSLILLIIIFILINIIKVLIKNIKNYSSKKNYKKINENDNDEDEDDINILKENIKNNELFEKELKKNNEVKNIITNEKNNKNYKIVAITYGSGHFDRIKKINEESAIKIGNVNISISFGPSDIDNNFKEENKKILQRTRGGGYWLWKPYIILKTLEEKLDYGDYLIYSDAGSFFMENVQKLINFLIEKDADVWGYQMAFKERDFTKRDTFVLMNMDTPYYTETGQMDAAYQFYRKSDFSLNFVKEYLKYAKDPRIITDDENTQGLANYPGFRDHRHDQSIFSLLCKKYKLAMTHEMYLGKITDSNTPYIFCHTRSRIFNNVDEAVKACRERDLNNKL